jgi:4,5-epoxidase
LGLQPRGIEVLDRIGAIGNLRESAVPLSRSIFRINGRQLAELSWVNRSRSGPANPLVISQADIEASLRNRLTADGGTVEWNQRVISVEDIGACALVRLADGTVIHADWVIGADGAHSVVRKAAGIGFPGVPRVERLLIADVCADLDSPRDAVVFFAGPAGLLGAFPLPGENVWRLMAPATGADRADLAPEQILDELAAGLAQHAGGVIRSVAWASSFRIHRRLADTYRRGRLLLVGDAAHVHSPVGAQGLNTGIGDAENLAWKLALVINGAHEELLDSYEAERRPIAAEVLSNTADITGILAGTGLMTRLLRDHAMGPMLGRRWVQRHIADKASQLSVTYRRGPLGSTGPLRAVGMRTPGLHPGDRVPDAEFTCENGDTVRLFTMLGPGWALLGPDALGAVAKARLGDVAVLPGDDDALLVRPDGHLAWRGRDPSKLAKWLDTALGRPHAVNAVSAW